MDGQWIDEFHHALHALVTKEVNGYYEDFGSTSHLVKSFCDSYVYTGAYSIHRKKNFGVQPVHAHYGQFVVFAQNHDQVGNRLLGDRLTVTLSLEKLKLVAVTYLLSPHVPMLFMGEEYGEKNPFQYFISHSDKKLIENVRKGRRDEFKYFNWDGEVPDPQSEDTFKKCKLSWKTDGEAGVMLNFYKTLITLRKQHPAMRSRQRADLNIIDIPFDQVIAFERKDDGRHIVVLLNFNTTKVSVTLPTVYSLKRILDSSDQQWNGPGAISPEFVNHHDTILLNPDAAVVFEML
jgi:maltooligosyltrehalose trehalohydrolase